MKTTKRPCKLQVRVSPEIHETIVKIADLSDESISECVNDLLESLLPGLKKTLQYLEDASKLDSQAKAHLAKTLEQQTLELSEKINSTNEIVENEFRQHKLPI